MSTTLPEGPITGTATGVTIRIHLQPRASKTELCGIHGNELKVRVTSPPVDDAANKLCIEFFARMFIFALSISSIARAVRLIIFSPFLTFDLFISSFKLNILFLCSTIYHF